ncbi:MAG TPA: aldehyde dehydrogenase [Candidatus Choladousia intestinigallinarum]|nr:aldehyde dehydrogenase [Candidatus Choladousia intestinigallinarum]
MKMIINGEKVNSASGKTQEVINPANLQVIDTVPCAEAEDVKKAIDGAVAAQESWASLPVRERCIILRRFADLVMERRLELGEILAKEAGKPYMKEAVWELDSVAYVYRGACDVAMHYYGATMPLGTEPGYDDDLQITIHEPLGTLACIIPYNFPPAIWAFKTAAALAAGNTIVVKAPSYDPMTLLVLHEMLHEAGLPAGVAQCLTGRGSVVGDLMVDDPRIACVNFTGSTEAGLSIAATAAKHLTEYKFELGGNDPFIVFEDADMDLVIKEAEDQARNNRQCCTGSKRFIVHNSLKDEFVKRLSAELDKLVIGDPMDPKVNMGPMIGERAAKTVEQQVNLTVSQGAKIARGGKRNGAFYDPTILVDVTPEMDIAGDMEVFGPVWPVIGFDTFQEAIDIANHSQYGLGGGVFSQNIYTCIQAAKKLKTGHIAINGSGNFRAAELPFGGGKKMSGNSRESLSKVMDEVTQLKSIVFRYALNERK